MHMPMNVNDPDGFEMPPKSRSNIPSLACAFAASLTTGGTTYAFGLYGEALKRSLRLSQSELETISTAFFVAGALSWLPGLFVDKFGPRLALSLGGFLACVSLLLYWATARRFLQVPHAWLVPVLSTLGVVVFLASALTTGSVFKVIVATCGQGSKGAAVGVAKGYVGLGAGVYTCLFGAIRRRQQSDLDFLPMAAFFSCVCVLIPGMLALAPRQQLERDGLDDESTPLHFRILYFSLLALAVLIVGSSLDELFASFQSDERWEIDEDDVSNNIGPNYGLALLLITIWLAPISAMMYLPRRAVFTEHDDDDDNIQLNHEQEASLPKVPHTSSSSQVQSGVHGSTDGQAPKNNENDQEVVRLLNQTEAEADRIEPDDHSLHVADVLDEEFTLLEMLQTPSSLLMLWTTTILVGAGIVETNNMGQMTESLGFSSSVTKACLALFSVAQAFSRVATGAVSEAALNWKTHHFGIDRGVPRPFFLVVASLMAFLAHTVLGLATNEVVFVLGTVLSGAAFGMVWPLMVLVTGELFGTAHVGANYMFYDGCSSAIGSVLLSKMLAEHVYEKHIDTKSPDPFTCIGVGCFRPTHLIVGLLCLSCVATSLCLMYTSRQKYNRHQLHST